MATDSSPKGSFLSLEREREICRLLADARLALLFGSAARDRLRSDSDLDLAVLYETPLSFSQRARLSGEIENLTGRTTDLIDLREAGPILKMQIARHGRPIVVNDPSELARFLAQTPSEYFDFKIERRAAEQNMVSTLCP